MERACNSILLKKKIVKDGKKLVRLRYLPYEAILEAGDPGVVRLPTMKVTLKFYRRKGVPAIQLMDWMKRRLNFDGYEIYATSGGWNHNGKKIDRDWLLPNKGQ